MRHRSTFRLRMDGVDAFGIIFFTQYWHWCQHAIEELMEATDHPLREILDSGIGFPLVHADIDFHHPLHLSDTVVAESRLARAGKRSLHFEVVFRLGETVVAEARCVQVAVRRDLQPTEVPEWLRALVDEPTPVDVVDPPR